MALLINFFTLVCARMLHCERFISVCVWCCRPGAPTISKKACLNALAHKALLLGVHGEPGRSANEWWRYRAQPHQVHRQGDDFTAKLVKISKTFSNVVFACRFYAGGRVESARHGAAQPRHLPTDAGGCHVQVQVNISWQGKRGLGKEYGLIWRTQRVSSAFRL
jgi:hypothetical protein